MDTKKLTTTDDASSDSEVLYTTGNETLDSSLDSTLDSVYETEPDDIYEDVFLDADSLDATTVYTPTSVTYTYNEFTLEAIMATLGAFLGIIIAAVSTIFIITLIANWKIFTKAGEKGWKTLIPFYNFWTFFKIAGLHPALSLLLLVPFVNFIILIIFYVYLSKSFGKSGSYAIGLVFLNLIFTLILAFDKSVYVGGKNASAPETSPESAPEPAPVESPVAPSAPTPESAPVKPSTPAPEPEPTSSESSAPAPAESKPEINIPIEYSSSEPELETPEAPAPEVPEISEAPNVPETPETSDSPETPAPEN